MDAPSPAHSGTQQADVQEANLADPHVEEAKEEQKGAEEHKAESAEETKEAPAEVLEITFPLEVIYCPVCSFPPGFCEFGPSFELCKRWIAYNCPELYPSLSEELTKLAEAPPPEEFKAFMKIKKTKTVDPSSLKISIQMKKRSGKKMVTEIKGLDLFNIKLKVAAKGLGRSLLQDVVWSRSRARK